MPGKFWGNQFLPDRPFIPGRGTWHCFEIMLKANSPGQEDGEQAAWIDGRLYAHFTGILWRRSDQVRLKRMTLGVYIHDNPKRNVVHFDDVALSTGYLGPVPGRGEGTVSADEAIQSLLSPIRERHRVPAMAGAVVTGDGSVSSGVVGGRRAGAGTPAAVGDLWHLGSNTKAMTAVAIARLVEEGKVRWDSRMEEVFAAVAPSMHPDMRRVTVRDLLAHRAGLLANLDLSRYGGQDVRAERMRAVSEYLSCAPGSPPGGKFLYSNLGYIIAGAVVEKAAGMSWEDAMRRLLFEPLDMRSAGFGGTGTPGEIDQPWGHRADGRPVERNGPDVDNPPVMGPAGRVHCTIGDWAKFVADQLRGARGHKALLAPGSYADLYAPAAGGTYGLGWGLAERAWGGGRVLTHSGDNTMNHAVVWMAPLRGFAVLVCVNQGGDTAAKACDEAASALIGWHAARGDNRRDPPASPRAATARGNVRQAGLSAAGYSIGDGKATCCSRGR
jgi:CubicO group peptidase (beta-lactamase class C family)